MAHLFHIQGLYEHTYSNDTRLNQFEGTAAAAIAAATVETFEQSKLCCIVIQICLCTAFYSNNASKHTYINKEYQF